MELTNRKGGTFTLRRDLIFFDFINRFVNLLACLLVYGVAGRRSLVLTRHALLIMRFFCNVDQSEFPRSFCSIRRSHSVVPHIFEEGWISDWL
jgi:hypothetical protein